VFDNFFNSLANIKTGSTVASREAEQILCNGDKTVSTKEDIFENIVNGITSSNIPITSMLW